MGQILHCTQLSASQMPGDCPGGGWAVLELTSTLSKIPYVKIQNFLDRSFTWFLNYFFAKFLEILTTVSKEMGKFLQKQSVSIFRASAHALI